MKVCELTYRIKFDTSEAIEKLNELKMEADKLPQNRQDEYHLQKDEVTLIKGCLIAQATMLTAFGKPSSESLELYRKLMNLKDKLEKEDS